MSSSPPHKKQKSTPPTNTEGAPSTAPTQLPLPGPESRVTSSFTSVPAPPVPGSSAPSDPSPSTASITSPRQSTGPIPPPISVAPTAGAQSTVPPVTSPNPRKRQRSRSPKLDTLPPGTTLPSESNANLSIPALLSEDTGRKRGRTNTPWTPGEEKLLKDMREAGNSWSEIAKAFPNRTEGSVKKHWYKDMHYAEFGEDESLALREAIREYDANKWKAIGQKLGKPAKACEQYAKEHFKKE